jgi:hypothetical protein
LYYIENISSFETLKKEIEELVVLKYKNDRDPFIKAELTLLFFDFINCPFVSRKSKRKVVRLSSYRTDGNEDIAIENIKHYKTWFMDWDINIDLERVLKKKEWGTSY